MPNRRDEMIDDACSIVIKDFDCRDGREDEIAEMMVDYALALRRELLEGLRRDVDAIETDRTFHEYKLGFKDAKADILALFDEAQNGGNAENTQPGLNEKGGVDELY